MFASTTTRCGSTSRTGARSACPMRGSRACSTRRRNSGRQSRSDATGFIGPSSMKTFPLQACSLGGVTRPPERRKQSARQLARAARARQVESGRKRSLTRDAANATRLVAISGEPDRHGPNGPPVRRHHGRARREPARLGGAGGARTTRGGGVRESAYAAFPSRSAIQSLTRAWRVTPRRRPSRRERPLPQAERVDRRKFLPRL